MSPYVQTSLEDESDHSPMESQFSKRQKFEILQQDKGRNEETSFNKDKI